MLQLVRGARSHRKVHVGITLDALTDNAPERAGPAWIGLIHRLHI